MPSRLKKNEINPNLSRNSLRDPNSHNSHLAAITIKASPNLLKKNNIKVASRKPCKVNLLMLLSRKNLTSNGRMWQVLIKPKRSSRKQLFFP